LDHRLGRNGRKVAYTILLSILSAFDGSLNPISLTTACDPFEPVANGRFRGANFAGAAAAEMVAWRAATMRYLSFL